MKFRTFAAFVGPSVIAMVLLIALPLVGVGWLAVHNSYVQTEVVEIRTQAPLFGGLTQTIVSQQHQPVRDANGNPVRITSYVGLDNLRTVANPQALVEAFTKAREGGFSDKVAGIYRDVMNIKFWNALEFTLVYTFVSTPFVLLIGFAVALAVNRAVAWLKGPLIFATLLPFIITPVVGSLSIYWLFLDNAIVSSLLQQMGLGKVYFLQDAFTIRSLIIFYGVWHVAPFAFIVLYAGLQSLPQDAVEAAIVDGASRWQITRYVTIPHLMPLFVFITLIHLMDAYRVFEPVLVFGSALFADSLQHLTYYTISWEQNYYKAAASAVLTVIGIVILLIPVLRRTWREQREA